MSSLSHAGRKLYTIDPKNEKKLPIMISECFATAKLLPLSISLTPLSLRASTKGRGAVCRTNIESQSIDNRSFDNSL
ncbi:hypothetical protein J6590_030299 [Homalodisca vitripennis]|nr:hypothetical protein J6590_030299 [Homalodisca vitripennis]